MDCAYYVPPQRESDIISEAMLRLLKEARSPAGEDFARDVSFTESAGPPN
jgi:hypothetical protein